MADTFFIGDTHFGHKNIIRFDATKVSRDFETIEAHDAEIVRRWNARVRPKDVVWHLGDFCFGKASLAIAEQLYGDKRLVMGNHDHYPTADYLKYFSKVLGAVEVKGMILTHIPVHPDQMDQGRYTHNIHGHLHTNILPDKRYINVSAEQINLTPISLDDILKRIETSMTEAITTADLLKLLKADIKKGWQPQGMAGTSQSCRRLPERDSKRTSPIPAIHSREAGLRACPFMGEEIATDNDFTSNWREMIMTEFGKAPWNVVGHNWQNTTVYDADNNAMCLLDLEDWGVTEDNQDELEGKQTKVANLIGAAPDLLAALLDVREWIRNWSPSFTEDCEWDETAEKMDAAITNATK